MAPQTEPARSPLGEAAQSALRAWYRKAARELPWRATRDPYAVWVSEIMLQQTQVATALPFYGRWMQRFPSVEALAMATEQEVLAIWQGLGYYRRARALLEGARLLAANGFPADAVGWRTVPGVGRYTAGAIASICYGEPAPVVDGNVKRVFARVNAFSGHGASLEKACWDWAAASLFSAEPGDWNQALMELGARVCKPREPECGACPLKGICASYQLGSVSQYPSPTPKQPVERVDLEIAVVVCDGLWGLRQANEGEWWTGLWCFPTRTVLEGARDLGGAEVVGTFRHTVTNHRLHCCVTLSESHTDATLNWHELGDLERLPMPAPYRRAMAMALHTLHVRAEHDRMAVGTVEAPKSRSDHDVHD